VARKSHILLDIYHILRRICKALGNKSKSFKELDILFTDFEKSVNLYVYTREWVNKKEFLFTVVDGINYPTVKTIISLHDFLVIKYERDIDKIHTGIMSLAPLNFEGIKYWLVKNPDSFEDIVTRGAHIFNKFLEEGHPFVDGNKRTGYATLLLFLLANGGYVFLPSNYKKGEYIKKIEQWADYKEDSKNIDEIVEWIKKYIRKK
jgi:death-on-curing family protein